ncbi:protein unc-93 homolog A-like [Physella acuta]|uniref:protein unc-93 homolog A-like n=1 Tax=Physella acuta TaxID=109671 RepID=UPI0027DAF086|nr:protein unc-93 homolog A-like [Physella acuta]
MMDDAGDEQRIGDVTHNAVLVTQGESTVVSAGQQGRQIQYGSVSERDQPSTSIQASDSHVITESQSLDPKQLDSHLPPIQTLMALSVSFLFISSANSGIQSLQSSVYEKDNLGLINMACVYAATFLSVPLVTSAVRKFGCKNLLLLTWICRSIFVGANFYPRFYTLIPASILSGASSVFIGTTRNLYINAASDSYIQIKNYAQEKRHQILSIFFGVYFAFFGVTQIAGNMVSSLVLYSNADVRSNNTKSEHCGAEICFVNSTASNFIQHPSQETLYMLFGVFLGFVVIGFLVTLIFLPRFTPPQPAVARSVCQEIASCYKVLANVKVDLFLPVLMAQSMMLMIMLTGFTEYFITCSLGVEWVGFVMMAYGTSTAIFSALANYLARYLGRIFLFLTFILLDMGLLFLMLFWNPGHNGSKLILFAIATVAGLTEGISQPQLNSYFTVLVEENLTSATATFIMAKSIAFSASLVISTFTCFNYRVYVVIALYSVGLVGYIILEIITRKRKHSDDQKDKEPLIKDVKS